jgi:multiple sugar transport system substrate-binding protein
VRLAGPPLRLVRRLPLLLAIGLLLIGCSPTPPAPAASSRSIRRAAGDAAAAPTTSITWSFWGDPWEVEINRRVARAFEAENPTIRVDLLHQPWDTYFTWLRDQWKSGQAPDVMFLDNVRGYASEGRLAPLDAFIERDGFDLSDFYPRLLELSRYQGSYFGLPRDNDTKVIFYNRTLFQDAGLEPPRRDWTWTDLRNLANRLNRRDAAGRPLVHGFAFEANEWWQIWVWQNGGAVFDDPFEPRQVRLSEPAAVDALQFLADLVHADRVTPPLDVLLDSGAIFRLFREGRLAMAFGNHAQIPGLIEVPDLHWDIVGLPARRAQANLAGGAAYTIAAGSSQKEAAWALVRFLEGPRGQALFNESGLIVPARRSIREDNIFLRQTNYDSQVFADETDRGRPNLNSPLSTDAKRLSNDALLPLWRGEVSAQTAVESLVPRLQQLLER